MAGTEWEAVRAGFWGRMATVRSSSCCGDRVSALTSNDLLIEPKFKPT